MQVDVLGGATQAQGTTGYGSLDKDAFMKILVAQLRYQNPLSPQQDSQQMIAQLTQFSMLEQLYSLGSQLESMVSSGMAGALSNMLGKEISYINDEGDVVSGIAESVVFKGGVQMLVVDGVEVLPEALTSIRNKEDTDA